MKPKKVKTVCLPLDPDECGSVISGYVRFPEAYRANYGKKLWEVEYGASLSLSDCNRVIQWNFGSDREYDIEKLDTAISALTEFRRYLAEAQTEMKKIQKENKAKNKELGDTPEE